MQETGDCDAQVLAGAAIGGDCQGVALPGGVRDRCAVDQRAGLEAGRATRVPSVP